ncbi:hypothetical protein PPYR_02857 [Photinus pyralis]|uniref:Cytochrome P450 n=1 Tax=Photinus pyralis TaxID=7054 RepID=A0A5N4A160_PHOPY|nr:cytochrome P450 6a2-like [Photinus pyralis]KAB0791057.1 hypothetical protein PPYR_02857 [Photinus pyralis]
MSLTSALLYFTSTVIATLVLLAALVALYFKRSWSFWRSRNVREFPVEFPYGNAKEIMTRTMSFGERIARLYEECQSLGLRYCGFYFFTKPMLMVTDVDLAKTILTKDFQHFTDHPFYVNEEVDPLSGHLFSLQGEKWRNLRAKLTPVFTSGKLKMMFQTIVGCSPEMVNLVGKGIGSPLDIKDIAERFTIDIIGTCAFGIECNTLLNPNSDFHKYGKRFFSSTPFEAFKSFSALTFPQIFHKFNLTLVKKDVAKFFTDIVFETVKYREENNIVRNDVMHLLLQLKNNISIEDDGDGKGHFTKKGDGNSLTMNELAAQAFVFFIAGFEAASITLTFCLYELAANMELQMKVKKEISKVLGRHGNKMSYEALMEMTYMEQCIYETLRVHPTISFISRLCTKTYKVPDSDLTINKGEQLHIPILGFQRDPQHFPDPLRFDPDRFSTENKTTRHPFSWLPFGEGPRICIGMKFGVLQTKVGLTALLMNYKFTVNPKTKRPIKLIPFGHSTKVDGGLWLDAVKEKI